MRSSGKRFELFYVRRIPLNGRLKDTVEVGISKAKVVALSKTAPVSSKTPPLTIRLLFAYDCDPFPRAMLGRYEFTRRSRQHRETIVSKTLGATGAGVDRLLRVPRNATTLALLPAESST